MIYVVAYFASLVTFLLIDGAWLASTVNTLYRPTLGDIMLPSIKIAPAALFYPIFTVGIIVFAVAPAFDTRTVSTATLRGALFGAFAFGLYDFTNLATLRNWTVKLALVDVGWGAFITAVVATVGYSVSTYIDL